MTKLEDEEDLARFRFDELMDVVEDTVVELERGGDAKEQAHTLRKVSKELRKRNPEKLQRSGVSASTPPAQVAVRPSKGVPSRTKGLREPGPRGRLR
jgi:hypothetical protein